MEVFTCRCPSLTINGAHETTLPECQTCLYKPRPALPDARKLILVNRLSPGDVLVMSAAVHSLHKAHPGRFRVAVDTSADAFFEHSPDVEPLAAARAEKWEEVHTNYDAGIQSCNQTGDHFMHAYCRFLEDNLQVRVPLATNRPVLWLSAEEKAWQNQVEQEFGYKGRFWLLNAGRKGDFTCKHWGVENFQKVVDALRGRVVFVQVGAAEHHHPPLRNVYGLVGRTDQRQLARLCWHAQGVLCGVTMLHHLAAGLEKPCVTIMGGREPVCWNSYPKCQLLHVVGALPCCRDSGCWKSRVVSLPDNAEQNNSLCELPIPGDEPVPKCMSMISPDEVAAKVLLLTGV